MTMTSDKKSALRKKYRRADARDDAPHDIKFSEVADDVNAICDALPGGPAVTLARSRYDRSKSDHSMMFWIAADDVNPLLDAVVPVDPQPQSSADQSPPQGGQVSPSEHDGEPNTEPPKEPTSEGEKAVS